MTLYTCICIESWTHVAWVAIQEIVNVRNLCRHYSHLGLGGTQLVANMFASHLGLWDPFVSSQSVLGCTSARYYLTEIIKIVHKII